MIRRKFNSGNCAIPRNDGLKFARGEYISFLDADDLITKTAFKELYNVAKKFDADVIHCEKYYRFNDGDIKNFEEYTYQKDNFVKKPTFVDYDISKRLEDFGGVKFIWNVWSKLVRRDFLLENNLEMMSPTEKLDQAGILSEEDFIWTLCLLCSAKKYIRVPNIINYYRIVADSLSHIQEEPVEKTLHRWITHLKIGLNYIRKFLDGQKDFQGRNDLKYMVYEIVTSKSMNYILPIYSQIPAPMLEELICKELEKAENKTELTAFFFSRMNVFNLQLLQQQQIIQQLQK